MTLLFDVLTGIGLACAVGARPFLPVLLAGALASDDLGLSFDHTRYAFLERPIFLLAVVVALIVVVAAERRLGATRAQSGPLGAAIAGVAIGLGAVLFAGVLAHDHYLAWPGLVGGAACALLAQGATRSLIERTRRRLDRGAQAALALYADGFGLVVAGLSVLAPPVSIIVLGFFGWLLVGARRVAERKHGGLRILR